MSGSELVNSWKSYSWKTGNLWTETDWNAAGPKESGIPPTWGLKTATTSHFPGQVAKETGHNWSQTVRVRGGQSDASKSIISQSPETKHMKSPGPKSA